MVAVDVIMPTWNSNSKIFREIVRRIRDFLTLHHLIVVDRFSEDGTLDVIRELLPNDKLIIIKSDADLAYARYLGIQYVDTPLFMFIDSDILIPKGCQTTMETIIKYERVGAVSLPLCGGRKRTIRKILLYNGIRSYDIIKHGLLHTTRGHGFLVMIKREIVADWKPPVNLSALETFSLSQHILSKGFLWVELPNPCCINTKELKYGHGFKRWLRQGLWEGAGARIAGIKARHMLLEVVARTLGAFLTAIINRNSRHLVNNLSLRCGLVLGYLCPQKFRVWRREH